MQSFIVCDTQFPTATQEHVLGRGDHQVSCVYALPVTLHALTRKCEPRQFEPFPGLKSQAFKYGYFTES